MPGLATLPGLCIDYIVSHLETSTIFKVFPDWSSAWRVEMVCKNFLLRHYPLLAAVEVHSVKEAKQVCAAIQSKRLRKNTILLKQAFVDHSVTFAQAFYHNNCLYALLGHYHMNVVRVTNLLQIQNGVKMHTMQNITIPANPTDFTVHFTSNTTCYCFYVIEDELRVYKLDIANLILRQLDCIDSKCIRRLVVLREEDRLIHLMGVETAESVCGMVFNMDVEEFVQLRLISFGIKYVFTDEVAVGKHMGKLVVIEKGQDNHIYLSLLNPETLDYSVCRRRYKAALLGDIMLYSVYDILFLVDVCNARAYPLRVSAQEKIKFSPPRTIQLGDSNLVETPGALVQLNCNRYVEMQVLRLFPGVCVLPSSERPSFGVPEVLYWFTPVKSEVKINKKHKRVVVFKFNECRTVTAEACLSEPK